MAKKYLHLSTNLKRLLFERGMKPADLARALNIPPPTIHRLVTGKSTRPYESSLQPIADFFSVNKDQLLGENSPQVESIHTAKTFNEPSVKTIPIITWEDVDNLTKARETSKTQIAIIGNVSDECFALIMNDYSMEILFPKKTILIFDSHKKISDRSYVLIKLEGMSTPIFRQILIDADHKYLKPLNPDLSTYKMRLLSEQDTIIACLIESRINHEASENENLL